MLNALAFGAAPPLLLLACLVLFGSWFWLPLGVLLAVWLAVAARHFKHW